MTCIASDLARLLHVALKSAYLPLTYDQFSSAIEEDRA